MEEKKTNVNVTSGCCSGIATILTVIFVIAKILGLVTWSWVVCFLPLIIAVGLTIIVAIIAFVFGLIIAMIKK